MKSSKLFNLLSAALFASLSTSCSSGTSAEESEDTFDAAVVCPAEGQNAYGEPMRGTFTDARDSLVYKYTTIGNQVWMAENLKFDAPYSVCYNGIEGFCDTFGRFYSLHVDGNFFDMFDQQLLDTICPAGWHVPSADEWSVLTQNLGDKKAGLRLTSSMKYEEIYTGDTTYLNELFGYSITDMYTPGTDDCAFNSKPAGSLLLRNGLSSTYLISTYWTSTARDLSSSYGISFNETGFAFNMNDPKMTIRCVKN